jgi:hypothetical protein
MHAKVQVNVEGTWVDGEVIGEMGMDYNVRLPNNRTAWATARHLRRVAAPTGSRKQTRARRQERD